MYLNYRSLLAVGVSLSAAATAFGDAYAYGSASVQDSLYDFGSNVYGGTGSQVSIVLYSIVNGNFAVTGAGPGTGSINYGGGLLDNGYDAGSGAGWSLFGENYSTSDSTLNFGDSDASNLIGPTGSTNSATEDTYNKLVFKVTNNSKTTGEYYNVELTDGVLSEVSLDNYWSEYGLDESLLEFGYANKYGDLTGNVTENEAYVITGMSYGTDTFDIVSNSVTDYYSGYIKPGQSIYLAVISENYSAVQATVTPGPAAIAPFAIGLIAVLKRRRKG
jgi:hypothetical protein